MTISEEKIQEVGRRAQENANLIWNVANSLFGAFKPHEYGLVILPMCVSKRFHDCLLPTRTAVLEANKEYGNLGELKEEFLREAPGYQFYNTSEYTFASLITDPENIEDNFNDYLRGFSDNVKQILERMNFQAQVDRMVEAGVLYQVVVDFAAENLDMSPQHISTVDMGYIFENLVQRFSESYNEEAGAHFTSRDIIYLMCDLLLTNNDTVEDESGIHCSFDAFGIGDVASDSDCLHTICLRNLLCNLVNEILSSCHGNDIAALICQSLGHLDSEAC